MTWTLNLTGHFEDRSKEQEIADIVRPIIEELKSWGLLTARFNGNQHSEDYLAAPKTEEADS